MVDVWAKERVALLTKLWADGLSCGEIGNELGVTRNAVIGKIHRLKLPTPAGKKQRLRRVQERFAEPVPPPIAPITSAAPKHRRSESYNIAKRIAAEEPRLPEHVRKGEAPNGAGVQIRDLTEFNCHWPKGDPREPDFEFCGKPASPGMPYCAGHCRIATRA